MSGGWCWRYRNKFEMFEPVVGKPCPDRDVSCLAKQRSWIYLKGVKTGQDTLDWPAIERAQCYPMVGEEPLNVSMYASVILARGHRNRPPNVPGFSCAGRANARAASAANQS